MYKYLKHEYFDNCAERLIIVTSCATGRVEPHLKKVHEENTPANKLALKNALHYVDFFKMRFLKSANLLYLHDYYNGYYGYHFIDGEDYILPQVVKELDQFIAEHGFRDKEVTILGISKGGLTARMLGYRSRFIKNIFPIIPAAPEYFLRFKQAVSEERSFTFRKHHDIFYGNKKRENISERVFSNVKQYANHTKNGCLLVGKYDHPHFESTVKNRNKRDIVLIEEETKGHMDIVLNHLDIVKHIAFTYPHCDLKRTPFTYLQGKTLILRQPRQKKTFFVCGSNSLINIFLQNGVTYYINRYEKSLIELIKWQPIAVFINKLPPTTRYILFDIIEENIFSQASKKEGLIKRLLALSNLLAQKNISLILIKSYRQTAPRGKEDDALEELYRLVAENRKITCIDFPKEETSTQDHSDNRYAEYTLEQYELMYQRLREQTNNFENAKEDKVAVINKTPSAKNTDEIDHPG